MLTETTPAFFSIIIPTRDRPKDFLKALKSVLGQRDAHFEVIVVVDGSSNENIAEYKKFQKAFLKDNVHFEFLVHRPRGHGHCFARNQGLATAIGEFICFLDDDDWWTDELFLKRAFNTIKNEGADFIFANQKAVRSDGTVVENVWVEGLPASLPTNDPRRMSETFKVEVPDLLKLGNFPHMNCWAVKKSLFESAGAMDECLRYEPDRDIFIRLLDKALSIWMDTNYVSLHNIPDKKNKNNASTLGSDIERLHFQLRTIDKAICNSARKDIKSDSIIKKSYILKHLTERLLEVGNNEAAVNYARQALGVKMNMKWLAYTFYLTFKKF
jgi:glycosyltransferase involved in cell wall biosynthesis